MSADDRRVRLQGENRVVRQFHATTRQNLNHVAGQRVVHVGTSRNHRVRVEDDGASRCGPHAQLGRARGAVVESAGIVGDDVRVAPVVELGHQLQRARGAATVNAVALHVEVAEVRVVQRRASIGGDREERIAGALRATLRPHHRDLIIARHQVEIGRLRRRREQEAFVEHRLRHHGLGKERAGRGDHLGLADLAVGIRVGRGHPPGDLIDQPDRVARHGGQPDPTRARLGVFRRALLEARHQERRRVDVGHDDAASLSRGEGERPGCLVEPRVPLILAEEAVAPQPDIHARVVRVAGVVGRPEEARQVPEQLPHSDGVGKAGGRVEVLREHRQPDLVSRRVLRRLQVLDPDKARRRGERSPEDVRRKLPADIPNEGAGVFQAQAEGHDRGRVVLVEHRDVRVHRLGGIHRIERVATVRDLDLELGLVDVLELIPDGRDLRLQRAWDRRVVVLARRSARRDVVERVDDVDDVFVAAREVPGEDALVHRDPHRVLAPGEGNRVALPVAHERISL